MCSDFGTRCCCICRRCIPKISVWFNPHWHWRQRPCTSCTCFHQVRARALEVWVTVDNQFTQFRIIFYEPTDGWCVPPLNRRQSNHSAMHDESTRLAIRELWLWIVIKILSIRTIKIKTDISATIIGSLWHNPVNSSSILLLPRSTQNDAIKQLNPKAPINAKFANIPIRTRLMHL